MTKRDDAEFKYDDPKLVTDDGRIAHPGGLVRTIIEGHGSTISATARAIKMDRASLSLVTSGQYAVTRDLAYKLGAYFSDHVADLLIVAIRRWEDQEGVELRAKYRASIARLAA